MKIKRIYLDYNATTPVDPRVAEQVHQAMVSTFGNSSSVDHKWGDEASEALERARSSVAELAGASASEVFFTSGATEAANIAIRGFHCRGFEPVRLAVTAVEHKAVLETSEALYRSGVAKLQHLQVDGEGRLDLDQVREACRRGLDLLCVMAANNETGVLFPIEDIVQIAHQHGVAVLVDASQAAGKIPIEFRSWNVDLLILSGHKVYAPKGIGALVKAADLKLTPTQTGGSQEQRLRPGTVNVPGAIGFGAAATMAKTSFAEEGKRITRLKSMLEERLGKCLENVVINGERGNRLPNTTNFSVPGVPNHAVIARIRDRIAVSTGSACTSGIETPSHVLQAMGLPRPVQDAALRVSLGRWTTADDIEQAVGILDEAYTEAISILA